MRNKSLSIISGILLFLLCVQLNAQDVRLLKTKIADILMQMPAKDATQVNKLMADIIGLGDEGLDEILTMLKPAGEGNDVTVRYALTSLARFNSQPGHGNDWDWMQNHFIKAIQAQNNKGIQVYLINQLIVEANDNCVHDLKGYLNDKELGEAVIQLFTSIHSSAAENALAEALYSNPEFNLLSIIKALGEFKSKNGLAAIIKLEGSSDKTLQKVVLDAVANIGEASSYPVLWDAAVKANFEYEPTQATASFIKYLQNLGAKNELNLCKKGCLDILKLNNQQNQNPDKAAAMGIYANYFPDQAMPLLLKFIDNPDSSYRMTLLDIAKKPEGQAYTKKWIQKAKKSNPEIKADIIYMLGERGDNIAVPFFRENLNDKSEKVRKESIWALLKLDEKLAVTDLLNHLGGGNDLKETELALGVLLDEKQLDMVIGTLNTSRDKGKPGLIRLIAQKSGKRFFKTVFVYTSSANPEIKSAAISALKHVSSINDIESLLQLLPELSNNEDIENVQQAIFKVLKDTKNPGSVTALILSALDNSTGKEQIIPVLPYIGTNLVLAELIKQYEISTGKVKDACLSALVNWPNQDAASYLSAICRSDDKENHKKAFEGYLNLISRSALPDDQKLLKIQAIMPHALDINEMKLGIEALSTVKTFLSLVYAGSFLDNAELKQIAANSAIQIVLPDKDGRNGFYGEIPREILQKCMKIIEGPESDYTKENIKKYLENMPDKQGFVSMFNGKDLSGWKAFVADPIKLKTLSQKDLEKKQQLANQKLNENWRVQDGMIVFSGEGNNLLSENEYADFEMIVNWRITKKGDSGIYLRGTPQVQIWDTSRVEVGAQVGSGGLYNNQKNENKPLKVADNPVGEWNTFCITMLDDKVTVYLNGELVVDNTVLENYWDRNLPIFPKGTIELQAHGTNLAFKDIYIREIKNDANSLSQKEKSEGFVALFNGKDLNGWTGDKVSYKAKNGEIVIEPSEKGGGNLYTENEYGDFIFRFEFKLTPAANNGLGIRAPLEGDAAYAGMELQILDNEAPVYADLKPYQYHGSVYGVIPAKRGFLKPTGEWNTEEVIVKGKNVKVILNGTVIVDGNIEEASKNGTMDHNDHPGLLREKGHIGFLGHGSVVSFRNIRIKEL